MATVQQIPASVQPARRNPARRVKPAANPRDSWPAWTDAVSFAPTEPAAEAPAGDGPAPSWDAERYEPDPRMEAYWLGFRLGREGEYPAPPAGMPEAERRFFSCGRLAGFIESDEGRAWYRDLAEGADAPPAEAHPCEAIEAVGCVEARRTA